MAQRLVLPPAGRQMQAPTVLRIPIRGPDRHRLPLQRAIVDAAPQQRPPPDHRLLVPRFSGPFRRRPNFRTSVRRLDVFLQLASDPLVPGNLASRRPPSRSQHGYGSGQRYLVPRPRNAHHTSTGLYRDLRFGFFRRYIQINVVQIRAHAYASPSPFQSAHEVPRGARAPALAKSHRWLHSRCAPVLLRMYYGTNTRITVLCHCKYTLARVTLRVYHRAFCRWVHEIRAGDVHSSAPRAAPPRTSSPRARV